MMDGRKKMFRGGTEVNPTMGEQFLPLCLKVFNHHSSPHSNHTHIKSRGVTVAQLIWYWSPDQKVECSIPNRGSGVTFGKSLSSTLPHYEKLIYSQNSVKLINSKQKIWRNLLVHV